MVEAPSGTVTLLFTDVEGSTKLLQRVGDAYADLLGQHRRLLRAAFKSNGGYEVDAEGDAFLVAFPSANDAVAAAAAAQQALARQKWPKDSEIRVRMGVHTGEPRLIEGRYLGLDVHRAARVMASAHGGQVVISHSTRDLLDESFEFRDLGEHRLKDLSKPQRLYQLQIRGLPHEFPPLRTLESQPTNLPVQSTPLVGREKELDEVTNQLRRDYSRLVTLTGPGGTGKTRLALQLAADMIDGFSDGVFFVSLAPISDPELVVPTIAQTLGLREQGGEPLLEILTEYLREKQLLLLLDNFEQVVQAAHWVSSLLASAPELKLLVTSRAPLHLSGERTYDVPPLSLPDPSRLPEIEALMQYEAVALFIERAQAAKADFAVTNENAPAIAEICVALDGLPLALELAAARIRALPPRTLLSRLDHRLKLLTGGAQDLEERQRTLRATIEWSYDLLSGPEKKLFARLGVFAAGCRVEAAEAVSEGEDYGQDVLDGLTSLVEKSLLRQKEDQDGEPRYWMLETIREFAYEQVDESAEADAVRRRHGEFFLRLSEEAAGELEAGEHQSAWLARLEGEHGNLRMALDFWRREPDSQLAMAAALYPLWWLHGHWREGQRWLDEALAASNQASPQRLKALLGAYYLAYLQGDTERARALLEEKLALARRLEDREAIAAALHGFANLAIGEGDHERFVVLEEESLSLCEGERHALYPLSGLAWEALIHDDYANACALFQRAVAVARKWGVHTEAAMNLASLATVMAFKGDMSKALALLEESVVLSRKFGATAALVKDCLPGFAALRSAQGDAERAVRLLSASDALRAEMGSLGGPVAQEIRKRILEAAQGELDEDRIASAFEAGQSLTLDEALAEALADPGRPPSHAPAIPADRYT
ncbi:MAG: adenylate/guanylate cyclase domain-containing protein [Solirubrobacteraceae bacterium]